MNRPRDRASAKGLLPRMEARPRKDGLITYRFHPLGGKPINLGTDKLAACQRVLELTMPPGLVRPVEPPASPPEPLPPPKEHHFTAMHRARREYKASPEGLAEAAEEAAYEAEMKRQREELAAMNREAAKERRRALVLAHANHRRAAKIQRTPPWVDYAAIRRVYEEARRLTRETGIKHHVDHVIPLQGAAVSGLHVAENMAAIPATDNIKKRNKFDPC